MPLTCYCEYDAEPGDVCWYWPRDYKTYEGRRSKRCASCGARIAKGNLCTEFQRYKIPCHRVEIAIYGEDGQIPRASQWHCETCADLWYSLRELGFECCYPDEDMRQLVKEYGATYGPAG